MKALRWHSQRDIRLDEVPEPCEFPFGSLFFHDKSIIASQGYEHEFPTAIAFLADGRVNCEPIITAKIKLDDIIEQGFKVLNGEQRGTPKYLGLPR